MRATVPPNANAPIALSPLTPLRGRAAVVGLRRPRGCSVTPDSTLCEVVNHRIGVAGSMLLHLRQVQLEGAETLPLLLPRRRGAPIQ